MILAISFNLLVDPNMAMTRPQKETAFIVNFAMVDLVNGDVGRSIYNLIRQCESLNHCCNSIGSGRQVLLN